VGSLSAGFRLRTTTLTQTRCLHSAAKQPSILSVEVKGTAFLARRAMLVREFGEERFNKFLAFVAEREPLFGRPILATTIMPFKSFLVFNDTIVHELYNGDVDSYFAFGEASAEWSLTEGPYRHLAASKSLDQFAGMGKLLYANFFTEGRAETAMRPGGTGNRRVIDLKLLDIPRECHHPYMEYAIPGYFKRGLELVSPDRVTMRALRGFSKGHPDVHYEFVIG
jgi:hypothetical protein